MSAPWPSDDDLPPLDVVVPDDARELDAEVRAYHRELRRRRAAQTRSLEATHDDPASGWRWRRRSWVLPAGILVCLGLVAVLLSMFGPRPARTVSLPLTRDPTAAPGELGGRLPETTLSIAGERVPVADLRPAVVALLPPDCGCNTVVEAVRRQSLPLDIPMYVVSGPRSGNRELTRGYAPGRRRGAVAATDRIGLLSATYLGRTPTFVLVHADGAVREVLSGVRTSDVLEPHLTPLLGPGARW